MAEETFQRDRSRASRRVTPKIADLPFAAQEAINVLRGNVQLSGSDMKLISITSASKSEGKSSVAVQLAKSMAGLKRRTLYMDCDIRKSKTLRRYHIEERTVGLTEYLCGRCQIEDIAYRTDNPWMDMIFTGEVAPNPSELLTSDLFDQLLEWAKENYDFVIVDTPPINAVIDGALISKRCDGTVMVIECGITERAQAIRMRRQLAYANGDMLPPPAEASFTE